MDVQIIHKHDRRTGVTSFVGALTSSLRRRGHDVCLSSEETSGFDVYIHNYNDTYSCLPDCDGIRCHVVHGTMDESYRPVHNLVDHVFVMSEHSQIENGGVLLRNGVDLAHFKPNGVPSEKLSDIFVADLRYGFALGKLVRECVSEEVDVLWLESPVDDIRPYLHSADLVVGLGRSMHEAMACGKPCINMGIRGGSGYITKGNFREALRSNSSGWSGISVPSVFDSGAADAFRRELNKYDCASGAEMRKLAVSALDIEKQVDLIIETINK